MPDGRWGGGGDGAWAAGVRAVVQYGMDAAALSVAGAGDVADGSVIADLLLLCAVRPCRPQSALRGTPIDPSGPGAAPTCVCWCCGVVGGRVIGEGSRCCPFAPHASCSFCLIYKTTGLSGSSSDVWPFLAAACVYYGLL